MWLQIIALLVIGLCTLFWWRSRYKQIPGIPDLDPELIDDDEPCVLLARWAENYGPIFRVERQDRPPVVFISDITCLRNIYLNHNIFKRKLGLLQMINYDKTTVDHLTEESDEVWKNITCQNWQQAQAEELEYFIIMLKNHKGNVFNEHRMTLMMAVNTMLRVLFDYRFHYEDLELHHFINMQETNFHQIEKLLFKDIFALPLLAEDLVRRREIDDSLQEFMDYYTEILKNNNQLPSFMPFIEEIKLKNGKNIQCSLLTLHQIFMIGVVTIASTLRWTLLYLSLNPSVQTKLQNEIDKMEPQENGTLLDDTINNILHIHKTVCLGPCFTSSVETSLLGYRIPENSLIYPNILTMKNCCNLETETSRSKTSYEEEQCLIFGQGVCPARSSLLQLSRQFIIILLSMFTFKIPDNLPSPSINPVGFLILNPQPFLVQAIERREHKTRNKL